MIFYLPIGDRKTASSRLRVHNIAPYLNATIGIPERYSKGDTLIIQKVHNPLELRNAKSQGAKVIFDIDDFWWDRASFHGMMEEADLITVDTEEKKRKIEMFNSLKGKVKVIPDSLDWDGITRTEQVKNGIACWTSYGNNAGYLEGIETPYQLKLITTPDYKQYFSGKCQFTQWQLETVDQEIRDSELMIIRLPNAEKENCKGMHKLLKSWANGVPCYTSPMPDYLKAMKEAGVDGYVVEDWGKLENKGFDIRMTEYALRYSAENIAKLWQEAVKALINPTTS